MIKDCVAFRLDDITPDMNWNNFYRIRDIFDKYQVKPLIGVVPENRDKKLSVDKAREDFATIVNELAADGWCIAMHGCFHVYDSKNGGLLRCRPLSEFAGHSYEAQLERLSYGYKLLEERGIRTKVFMAPGHTFDVCTIEALVKLGFEYITDGFTDEPYKRYGISFLPSKNARPKVRHGFDTICLHTNDMCDEDFAELETFLKNHRSQVIAYTDMLRNDYPQWGPKFYAQDKKNRIMQSIRRFVASNKLLHGLLALRK